MKWGLAVGVGQDLEGVLKVSRTAYDGGIDQIWLVDFPAPQMSSIAALLLAKEVPVKLGIGLLIPLLYSPEQMVRAINTIRDTYEAEPDIMIGSGDPLWMSRIGLEYSSGLAAVKNMKEVLQNLKELLKKREISSRVLLGAQGPKMIGTAQFGDGVLLNYSDPTMIQWAANLLSDKTKGFVRGVFPPTVLAEEAKELPKYAKASAAIVALGTSSRVLERFGLLHNLKAPRMALRKRGQLTEDIIDSIPERILDLFVLYCTPKTLSEYVRTLESMDIDLIVFGPPLSGLPEGVELLVRAKKEYDGNS